MSVLPIQRKPSNETLCTIGTDSTLDSRMSSTDVPQMELLKVNYVHQCKEAFMPKIETISNYKYLDLKNPPLIHSSANNVARISINRAMASNKPLPPAPPPPTIESWQFLQNSKRYSSSPTVIKDNGISSSFCQGMPGCEINDGTITGKEMQASEGIKSNSWNYHNKISTCDIKRDIAKAGMKSRADRIANIEKTECEHRQAALSTSPSVLAVKKINEMFEAQKKKLTNDLPPQPQRPAPLPHKEPNRRLRAFSSGLSVANEEFTKRINSSKLQLNSSECLCNNEKISEYLDNVSPPPPLEISHIPKILPAKNRKYFNDKFTKHEKHEEENSLSRLTIKNLEKQKSNESSADSLAVIDERILRNSRAIAGNYHKAKVERIHIRKKRQPLLIINQKNTEELEKPSHGESKQTSLAISENECNKLKRLSLESNSDSGISSAHDHKETELNDGSNLKNVDECSDCIKFNYEDERSQCGITESEHLNQYSALCNKNKTSSIATNKVNEQEFLSKTYGSQIKIEVGKSCSNTESGDFSSLMTAGDPNDLQNFSNKNLTKPTTAEALNSSITRLTFTKPFKQCNIENEQQRLKFNNTWRSSCSSYGTTSICIEEDWKRHDKRQQENNDEDFIETDSLMINEQLTERKPINCDDNCVKIFVRSSVECNNSCRASCKSANSFISQTSIRTNSSAKASVCSNSSTSSASLTSSSSVCFSSSADNQSICNSVNTCCCQYNERSVSSLSENNRNSSCSPVSSSNSATADAMSEISCVTCNQEQKQERLQPTSIAKCPAPINFETTCCNAADGVFWNSSYFINDRHRQHGDDYEENEENAPCCCCSLSSCDDDCSLYEEEIECNGNCANATNGKHFFPNDYVQLRSGPFKVDAITTNIANGRNTRNSSAEEILLRNRKFPWKVRDILT